MASIESSIRSMLMNDPFGNVPNFAVSLGARVQGGVLPAYTYEVQNVERADIQGQWSADLEIRCIAETVDDSLLLFDYLVPVVIPGTYDGIPITAAILNGRTIDAPIVGEGDEREPAELSARWQIIYTG